MSAGVTVRRLLHKATSGRGDDIIISEMLSFTSTQKCLENLMNRLEAFSRYLPRGSVPCCSAGPTGRAPGTCREARCRSSEAGQHDWGALGVRRSWGGVRQGRGHLSRHPLSHHPRGPGPWRPTRADVWSAGRCRSARAGLHGRRGL